MDSDHAELMFTVLFACVAVIVNTACVRQVQGYQQGLISAPYQSSKVKVRIAGRIVNGERADIERFPYMVSIQRKHNVWQHYCGGSIFSPTVILTACHCVVHGMKINGDKWTTAHTMSMRVVAGTSNWKKSTPGRQIVHVSNLMAHPGCSNFARVNQVYNNDVGLVILQTPLTFTDTVQPIKLVSYDIHTAMKKLKETVLSRTHCYTPGWGFTVEAARTGTTELMVTAVIPMTSQQCREQFCHLANSHCHTDFYKIHQVCVVSADSSDCYGDSGGPLVCNGYLYGTVSYGHHCYPGWPTVFQNIRPILEILNPNTGYSLPQGPPLPTALKSNSEPFTHLVQTTSRDYKVPKSAGDIVNANVNARYYYLF